ncbi:MAG TPA: type I methionyl aminopeptidase [Oligoflexia bacterium]|nr:type I methionyl aminopeptidase [Oligoflexia bacterium]
MIHLKSPQEIEIMRRAGRATANILREMAKNVRPGITTGELDQIAEKMCKELGVKPAFKGYKGFPACVCISVNDQVVHGIPGDRVLENGDIVGLDFGVIHEGYHGDSAITVPVGTITPQAQALVDATRECLMKGIEQAVVGNKLFDISHAVQNYVEGLGFSVVREFVGHGIGKSLHEDPQVPNYGPKGRGVPLKEGLVLAIEPMINAGTHAIKVESDGWTAVTIDGSLSAHFEHTIAITKNGPEILTLPN